MNETQPPPPRRRSVTRGPCGWAAAASMLVLSVVWVGYVSARHALAESVARVELLGGELGGLGPRLGGGMHTLTVNGLRVHVASLKTSESVHEVMDQVALECTGEAFGYEPARGLPDGVQNPWRFGVLRSEAETEGRLACLARPEASAGWQELVEGVTAFARTGDLARLGGIRYAVARRTVQGRTHVVRVWSEGPLPIAAALGGEGDARGDDPLGLPRPPGVVRRLSVGVEHSSVGLRVYEGGQSVERLSAFYSASLPRLGWESLGGLPRGGELGEGRRVRAFVREGRALVLGFSPASAGALVSVVEMGSD